MPPRPRGEAGVPLLALRRPPWIAVAGDRWIEVSDAGEAVRALGQAPRRVFLALGRKELAPFAQAPQHHYLIRSVDPVEPPLPLPHASYVTGRGPFSEADDRALMTRAPHRGRGRQEQRRQRDLRQDRRGARARHRRHHAAPAAAPEAPAVETIEDAIAWLDHALTSAAARGV